MLWIEKDGGHVLPEQSSIGRELKKPLDRLKRKYGEDVLLPVYQEKGVYNFYLQTRMQEEISSLGSP